MQPTDPRQQGGQLGFNMQHPAAGNPSPQQPAGLVRDLRTWTPDQQPGGALTLQQLPVQLQHPAAVAMQQQLQSGFSAQPPPPGSVAVAPSPHGPMPSALPAAPHPSTATATNSRWNEAVGGPTKPSRWDAPGGSSAPLQGGQAGGWQQHSGAEGLLPPAPPSAPHKQQPPPPAHAQQHHQQLPPPPPDPRQQQQPPPPPAPGHAQQQQQQPPPPAGHPQQHGQQPPPPPGQAQQQKQQRGAQQQQPRPPRRGRRQQQPPPPPHDQRHPPPPAPPPHDQRHPPPPPQQQQQQQQLPPPPQGQPGQPPQQQQPLPPQPAASNQLRCNPVVVAPGMVPGPPSIQQQQQPGLVLPGPPGPGVPPGAVVAVSGPLPPGAVLVQGPAGSLPQQPGVQYVIQQPQQPGQQQVVVTYLPAGAQVVGAPGLGVVMGGVQQQQQQQQGIPGQPPSRGSAAGSVPGAPPPPPPAPTMAVLLKAAGDRLQDLFLVLSEIPRFLEATHASTLSAEDTVQLCQAVVATLPAHVLPQAILRPSGPAVDTFYKALCKAQPQLSVEQQLLVLHCLRSLSRCGFKHCFADLISSIATSLGNPSEMADCTRFESTAQVLIQLSKSKRAAAALLPCTEALLGDSVLRRLLKEDADVGCGVLIAVLLALDAAGIVISKQVQESVHKFLQDAVPRFSPTTLAGLLACHTSLGLGNTTKLLRRAAAEYQRRPEPHPSVDMLLGVMTGLVAAGRDSIRELPQQLLTRLLEDLQTLLPNCTGPQLLKMLPLVAQLGCIRSTKQQQFTDQLVHHLSQQLLHADVLLELPVLISSLTESEAAQSQPGLGLLITKLAGVYDSKDSALDNAPPADVFKLAASLQQQQKLEQGQQQLPELPQKLLSSIRELAAAVAAATASTGQAAAAAAVAAAAGAEDQAAAAEEAIRLEQQQKQLMRVLSFQDWVLVVEIVKQFSGRTGGAASILMPVGGEEVALLLQAMLESDVLHQRLQQVTPAAPAPPPAVQQQQGGQQRESSSSGRGTPPLPTAAIAAGSDGGGGSSSEEGAAKALLLPMVFVADDWQQLDVLLTTCLEWYPLNLLPLQLLQLVLEVLEVQAAVGGMTTCSKLSAVGILWGLGIVGALSYELWDVLSAPLDSVSEPLKDEPLLRVFEAYCLAVLRNTGPAPCAILMDQLVPAGHAFSSVMLRSAGDARKKLLRALVQAGLVPSDSRSTRVVDGHMMLYDVINTESKQAWIVTGTRSPLLCAAAGRLLSAAGWVQLQLSADELDRTANNAAQQAQRLMQLSQVADLLPRLSAIIRDYKAKQLLKQQSKKLPGHKDDSMSNSNDESSDDSDDELDEDDMQQLMQLVQYLTSSLANGTLLQPLQEKQMAYLQHIAEQYTGPVHQQLPQLPPLGSVRAARHQQQHKAALAALADAERKKHKGPPWALDESTLDPATLQPNSISIQDVFALNRNGPAAAAMDPGWYGQRLLALPPDVKDGTPAAAAAAAAELTSRRAAAAAAFVINCRQAKAAAAASAAQALADAEAAATALALQQQQRQAIGDGDVNMLDVDAELGRGRSPTQQAAKRRRHWRDSRSRSRSCSADSATSTSTRDSSSSSGRSSGSSSGRGATAGEADSEEGALSQHGSEEGQVASGEEEDWARAYWAGRQSRTSADASNGILPPASFAARGVRRPQYKAQQQQQQLQTLKRGRPRSRSRSEDSREWGGDRQYRKRYGRGRRDRRSRSRSRSRSRTAEGSPVASPTKRSQGTKWATSSSATAGTAAAAAYGVPATAAMTAAGYGLSAYGMGMAGHALQQQQAAAVAAAAAAQQHQFEGAGGTDKLLALFQHMPAVRGRLGKLMQEGWFVASDVRQSALLLMLQLDEAKMQCVLTDLQSKLVAHEAKMKRKQQQAAAAAGTAGAAEAGAHNEAGAEEHKRVLQEGLITDWLVTVCRQMGARKPAGAAAGGGGGAAAGSLAAAAAMRNMYAAAGYQGWGYYMAAAAAAAGGGSGAKGAEAKGAAAGSSAGSAAYQGWGNFMAAAAATAAAGGGSGATGTAAKTAAAGTTAGSAVYQGWGNYMAAVAAAAAGSGATGTAAKGIAGKGSSSSAATAAGMGKIGGYMLVNGALVPVPAQMAAALAARQGGYGYGGLAAAAGTSLDADTAAAAAGSAAEAGAGSSAAGHEGVAAGAGTAGKSTKKSSYWDALNSGLDADLDGDGGSEPGKSRS